MSSQIDKTPEKVPAQAEPACYQNGSRQYQVDDDDIDLLEYWNVIWGGRYFITIVTGVCTLVAVLVTLYVLPVTFRSEAVLQPVAAEQSSINKLSSLTGGLTSVLGIGGGDGNNQQLVDFLSSRNLKQRLIEKYELLPRLYADAWDTEQKKWKENDPEKQPSLIKVLQRNTLNEIFSVATNNKTALITLAWVDEDPAFASLMLERVIQELKHYLEFEYETDAQRERVFTEEQLKKTKHELEFWEQQVPGPKLTQGEIQRELMASQLVYQELRKQLELAKIQEAKQIVSFKVLDPPFVPEIKYKPRRAKICIVTLIVSGFIAVFLTFIWRRFKEKA